MSTEETSSSRSGLTFAMLGPLQVLHDGVEVPITTRRQRALLVLLLQNVGRVVTSERLIDQLWDGTPPPQAAVTLRSYVSNLRNALGGREGMGSVLVTRGQGYLLDVSPESVDATVHKQLTESARSHLRSGDAERALRDFSAAIDLWRGEPLAEIADHETAQASITEYTETHLGATEGLFEAQLATGRHLDALPRLETFTRQHPLREKPRSLLILALYRAGRAAEALEVHRSFRELLAEELGIDPSEEFDQLQHDILNRAPHLAAPTAPAPGRAGETPVLPDDRPSEPTPALLDERAPPPSAPSPTGGWSMVGRQREQAIASAYLDTLQQGRGALLLIAGEPGIGKTTLLESIETEAAARGVLVCAGRSLASSGAPTFWPWTQVLDALAAQLDDGALSEACTGAARPVAQLSSGIADRVGQPPAMTGDSPQAMRFMLYEAVAAFLENAASGPMLVALDDIHWADRASLELLSFLTPLLSSRPVLVIATYRDLASDSTPELEDTLATVSREDFVEEMKLAGLGHDDVSALAQQLAQDRRTEPPADDAEMAAFVDLLLDRTGGNPFFIRQLGRLLVEAQRSGSPRQGVPSGIRHVIANRLRSMSQSTLGVLEAAAIIGREFSPAQAAAVASLDVHAAVDACDEATRHGLLEPAGQNEQGFRFVHALVQEVVRESLPRGRAARLHAAAGRLVDTTRSAPDVAAEHMWLAKDIVGAEALPLQLTAAESAASLFAYDKAEQYLRRALSLAQHAVPPDPDAEMRVLLLLIRLITIDRGWGDDDARKVVNRATALIQPGVLADDTTRLWWSMFFSLLDRDDTSEYVEVAESLARKLADVEGAEDDSDVTHTGPTDTPPGHAARAAIHMMTLFARLAADDEAGAELELRLAREHVDAADAQDLAAYDEHLHVMLLLVEAHWAALAGDVDSCRSAGAAAIAIADADGRPFPRALARTLSISSLVYLEDPLAENAEARIAEALDFSHRFGFGWLARVGTVFQHWISGREGRNLDEAAATIDGLIGELRGANRLGNLSIVLRQMADILIAMHREDDAIEALQGAIDRPGPYQELIRRDAEKRIARLRG